MTMSLKLKSSNIILFILLINLFFYKIVLFFMIKNNLITINLGGGNDSDYYHAYAIGITDVAVKIWPVLLRFLNDASLYSREGVSYFLLLLNQIFIPVLFIKIVGLNYYKQQKIYLYAIFICLYYPTLFFYTLDIYRDVFMMFIFLLSCLFVKKFMVNKNKLPYFILSICFGTFLYKLRPYLGFAFLISLIVWKIKLTKSRIFFIFLLYMIILFIANYFGCFSNLLEYRTLFSDSIMNSGSTMLLDFSNYKFFLVNYIESALYQLFGLYIINIKLFFVFVIESIPFIYMLIYVILNIRFTDKFNRFLIIFFVVYGTIWIIANDNLGTAIRLRMFNYFSIYLCYFYILSAKNNMTQCKT